MKAIILAAGYATRLYPLTLNLPKPLLRVGDKTILEHLLKKLENIPDLDKIYIVTNNKFYQHFLNWKSQLVSKKEVVIVNDRTTCNEDRLGSIGDINFVYKYEKIDDDIIILGGDNLFVDDLLPLYVLFKDKGSTSIAVHDVKCKEKSKALGIVLLDEEKIIDFEEKPLEPKSTLAATLIYILKKEDLYKLPACIEELGADKAGNFIEYLSKNGDVYAYIFKRRWFDIGTKDALEEADKFYSK